MKRFFASLLVLCVLSLAGCAKQDTDAPEAPSAPVPVVETPPAAEPETPAPPEIDPITVYDFGGLRVPVPTEYLDLLLIDTELEAWNAHWTPLVSFAERASVEAGQLDHPDEDWGDGMLCTVSRLDRIGFESWLSDGQDAGGRLFAKGGEDAYYLMSYPTDVRIYRAGGTNRPAKEIEGLDSWVELNDWAVALTGEIIALNGLTAYDGSDLLNADYTYSGEHVELGYRIPGDQPMDLVLLALSQPVRQGEGGIWCIERVRDVYTDYDFTDTRLVFPAAYGVDMTAADYYARLQAECDVGEHPVLLTPQGAALDYARRDAVKWLFGEDVSATDFEIIEALG